MSYIGNTNTTQAFTPAIDYFSGNASTTAFTLSRPVASVAQVQVVVNNVAQNPSSAYTVSSNTITFTSAPSSGTNNIYVYYTSPITQVITPGQGTVGTTQLQNGLTVNFADGTAAAPSITNDGDTNTGIFFPAADTIAFSEGGVESMRIDSSGNVGIGTSSPAAHLEISGTETGSGSSFKLTNTTASTGKTWHLNSNNSGKLFFSIPSVVDAMIIDSSGNVGIGTASPTQKLQVNSSGASGGAIQITNASTGAISTDGLLLGYDGSNDVIINNQEATATKFYTSGTERMRIDSSGNVLVTNAARLGYGTGSGGTVTQATNKTTGVTLNKPTGQITMRNSALAANTEVGFTLSNSLISIEDSIIIVLANSAGSMSNYNVRAAASAGAAIIYLKNITTGTSLGDAMVLNFAIIKGATS